MKADLVTLSHSKRGTTLKARGRVAQAVFDRLAAQLDASEPTPPVVGPLTVVFCDMGQDFLQWDLDAQGVVIDSRPFQRHVWAGMKVIEQPRPGEQLRYLDNRGQTHTIRYPVREVRATRVLPAAAGGATESP
jgi:hypothetical protein